MVARQKLTISERAAEPRSAAQQDELMEAVRRLIPALPIASLRLRLRFAQIPPCPSWELGFRMAPALKRELWRCACAHGGHTCAQRAEDARTVPRCEEPGRCVANLLIPLDDGRVRHLPPRLGIRVSATRNERVFHLGLERRGLGARTDIALLLLALQKTCNKGFEAGGARLFPHVELLEDVHSTVGDFAAQLSEFVERRGAHLRLVTPWLIDKESRRSSALNDLSNTELCDRFVKQCLRRVYQVTSLAIEDLGGSDARVISLDPRDRYAQCMAAQSQARAALDDLKIAVAGWPDRSSGQRQSIARVDAPPRRSVSNDQILDLNAIRAAFAVSGLRANQMEAFAPALIFGIGQMCAEGFGSLELAAV